MYIKILNVNTKIGDYMESTKNKKIVNKFKAKEKRMKNALVAFIIGGVMGVLGQIIIEMYTKLFSIPTSTAGAFMSITFIFLASLFTGLGFFDTWVSFAKCGLIVPITGFAHSMTSSALDTKTEGPISGLGSNMFKLTGSVILYGVVSAWIFGIIRYFIGG